MVVGWPLDEFKAVIANAIDYVRFSFAASQDNIKKSLEKIAKMLG